MYVVKCILEVYFIYVDIVLDIVNYYHLVVNSVFFCPGELQSNILTYLTRLRK